MFWNTLVSEWVKIRKSSLWVLLPIGPLLGILLGWPMVAYHKNSPDLQGAAPDWMWMYGHILPSYAALFLPLLAGLYAALLCRYEHLSGGWKQLMTLPVSRSSLYVTKLVFVLALLALTQLLWLGGVYVLGVAQHMSGEFPWGELGKSLFSGWLTLVPLAALQLWVSTLWKSFGVQFGINAVLAIPGLLLINSATYGPYYPWSLPFLGMSPSTNGGILNLAPGSLGMVLGSSAVLLFAGWTHFVKRDVQN